MVILRVGSDHCERCKSHIDKTGFQIIDGHGLRIFLCLRHVLEELKVCCDHERVVGEEC
jgi:hypothetical protein